MQIDDDLSGYSVADEKHQREWREWFKKTFDESGNLRDPDAFGKETDSKTTSKSSIQQTVTSSSQAVSKPKKIREHTF